MLIFIEARGWVCGDLVDYSLLFCVHLRFFIVKTFYNVADQVVKCLFMEAIFEEQIQKYSTKWLQIKSAHADVHWRGQRIPGSGKIQNGGHHVRTLRFIPAPQA